MSDDRRSDAHRHSKEADEPRVDKPLYGPRKPGTKPLLLTILFLVALAGLFFLGWAVLIPSD